MKTQLRFGLVPRAVRSAILTLVATTFATHVAEAATIVNFDFDGHRGSEPAALTYVGQGAAGGGTVFNGVSFDSGSNPEHYDLQKTVTNVVDSFGQPASGISFSLGVVGGDNPGGSSTASSSGSLFGDYVFIGTSGVPTSATLTVNVPSGTPTVDLYLYESISPPAGWTIAGQIPATFNGSGIFTGSNTIFYHNVPVTQGSGGGTVTATMSGAPGTAGGFTVVLTPEPAGLMAVAAVCAGLLNRRRRATRMA